MRLVEELTMAGRVAPSRVLFGPHVTNLARGRAIGDRHVAYYERRARGGTGLLVTEIASVHGSDWPYERAPLAADCKRGWRAVAERCNPHGTLVLAGLGHAGLQGSSAYSQRELWAPSRVPDAVTRELPKSMEAEDIASVVAGFGEAAELAALADLDGVEINAGQHSLVRQFLSGLTNLRADEWGPDDDGRRLAFASAVIERVRAAIGDRIVGLRLSGDELAPWAGLTPELAADLAAALADAVDYIVVERGSIYSLEATRPDAHVDTGFNLDLVAAVRSAVDRSTLVVAQGSIVDPGQAEWAITDGRCEAVEMTRALIADPDLVAKTRAGTPETVRPCIRCNQTCQVRDARNPIVTCVVNPSAGHELDEPEDAPNTVASAMPLLVVGAGPAGLECARVSAAAGRAVTVVDGRTEPGGAVPDWTGASGRGPLRAIVDWLAAECGRLGVELDLGRTVTADHVAAAIENGEAVVLSTGSRPGEHNFAVAPGADVRLPADVLAEPPAGSVLVWDPIGGPIGIGVAESLATGCEVTLVTPDVIAGTLLSLTGDLAAASTRMAQAGIDVAKRKILRAVEPGAAVLEDRFTGVRTTVDADIVVDAGSRLPDDELWRATGEVLPRAGDAVAPRTIHEAILEGRRLAIALAASHPVGAR